MTKIAVLILTLLLCSGLGANAQQKEKQKDNAKEKKSVKEVLNELPEMLIAQPDAGPDTNANKLINDNLSIVVNPLWREKGLHTLFEFKVLKTDVDPLKGTFPLPDKKLAQGLIITMNTMKKPASEKKQAVLTTIKNHLAAYYKELQVSISAKELSEKADAMQISSEPFTTAQGKQGELLLYNDIELAQSNFIFLLLIPGTVPNTVTFLQFNYIHYTYETSLPEDYMELKMFSYSEDQQTYIDFTKSILKTFRIQ